ncbi:MAG: acyl-CoA dehydrogenase family protein [Rhodospirillales bacterium]
MTAAVALAPDVTPDELVARARALAPRLAARQAEADEMRQVPAASVAEMLDAGLYRVIQPKCHGGLEHGLDTFVRVGMEVAAGCGSTGWIFTTAAQHQWQIGMFHPKAQEDVWGADARALAASSYAPGGTAVAVAGGWRISGTWLFCSGVDRVQWMVLGARTADAPDAAPTGGGYILVPKSDFTVEDNWHVLGLRGTGSKNVILKDVFVPAHRLLTQQDALSGAPPGAAINPGPLFRIPFFAAITICLCAAVLGMAQGAVETFLQSARRRDDGAPLGPAGTGIDSQIVERRIGEAVCAFDAARALVLEDCRRIMDEVAAGGVLSQDRRAANKGHLGYAATLCMRAVDLLYEAHGGPDAPGFDRLQRAWRDVHAGGQHISLNYDAVGSLYGRVAAGLPAGPMQF